MPEEYCVPNYKKLIEDHVVSVLDLKLRSKSCGLKRDVKVFRYYRTINAQIYNDAVTKFAGGFDGVLLRVKDESSQSEINYPGAGHDTRQLLELFIVSNVIKDNQFLEVDRTSNTIDFIIRGELYGNPIKFPKNLPKPILWKKSFDFVRDEKLDIIQCHYYINYIQFLENQIYQ